MGVPVPVICCLIAGVVIVLIFCGAFFVELFTNRKEEVVVKQEKVSDNDFDIDAMLKKLEEKTKEEEKQVKPVIAPAVIKEVKPVEPVQEKVEEEEDIDFEALFKQLEEESKQTKVKEEKPVVEEKKEEVKVEKVAEVPVITGPEFDYNVRIQTIRDSLVKLEKDLAKSTREVNKFEKTRARKERNEKLLDRKSAELANLNLVLYNVNNLGDVDPEKKKKQEDLIEHITELKSSIKTAEEYLVSNEEKYLNSKKIKDFLTGEKTRYNEEIAELEQLIEKGKNKKK